LYLGEAFLPAVARVDPELAVALGQYYISPQAPLAFDDMAVSHPEVFSALIGIETAPPWRIGELNCLRRFMKMPEVSTRELEEMVKGVAEPGGPSG
jgi:hypothetical protein